MSTTRTGPMELLAAAGFPDGFEITVLSSDQFAGWPEGGEVAEAIASMWNQVGVRTNIENREANEVYLRAREFNITRNEVSIQMFPVLDLEILWNSAVQGPGSAIFYHQGLADTFNNEYQPELDSGRAATAGAVLRPVDVRHVRDHTAVRAVRRVGLRSRGDRRVPRQLRRHRHHPSPRVHRPGVQIGGRAGGGESPQPVRCGGC